MTMALVTWPAISAHRGGRVEGTELQATWSAYRDALNSGAEYVEFDIRRTGDGTLVAYHDSCAIHDGPALDAISHADLCALVGYDVPRVDELMELIAGKMIGHLDLKEVGGEVEIVERALALLGAEGFVVTSLEDASIATITQHFPSVKTALSLGGDHVEVPLWRRAPVRLGEFYPLRRIRACGADGVALNHRLARTVLPLCAANDLFAMVWTVNDDARLRRFLADPRVDVVITDRPRRALALREARTGRLGGT